MTSLADLPAPPTIPVFGNLHKMRPLKVHSVLEGWAAQYGTPFRVMLAKRPMLVTANPQSIQKILRERPTAFRRGRPVESVFAEMGVTGVFSAEAENWQKQRSLVMRAFDPTHLRDYFPSLVVATERLKNRWRQAARDNRSVDLVADLMRYTVDVTAGLAFGVDINTLENEASHGSAAVLQTHLDKVFPMINRRLTMPFAYWRHIKLPADRALDRHLAIIQESITGFIAQARQRMQDDPSRREHPKNLIEALLISRDGHATSGTENTSNFTDADVSGNVFTALLAGEDTTANTLAWLFDYLCDSPSLQTQLADEAKANDPSQRFEAVQELKLHDAAIQEAMRLKPVAPVLFFQANEACELDGIELEKNAAITTLMRLPGLDANLFSDPLRFKPERWLTSESTDDALSPNAKKALMPFGAGPRFCPGRYLALLEIKMVTAMMTQHFIITRKPGAQVTERYNLSMMPEGLWVNFQER